MTAVLPQSEAVPRSPSIDRPIARLVTSLLERRSPAEMVSALKTFERLRRTEAVESEIKTSIKDLVGHLEAARQREALATALAVMFVDADYAIGRMRRDGVLRSSRYGFNGLVIANIARAGLDARPWLVARDERFEYLKSVLALTRLAPGAMALHGRVVKILSAREDVALKTVFAVLNARFYHYEPPNPAVGSLQLGRYSAEDLSDAASLILTVYRQLFPIHDDSFNHIDAEALDAASFVYERLFLAAVRLTKFQDAEIMIDGLPFQARVDRGAVRVSSIDPDVEKTVRLGYIQNQIQVAIRAEQFKAETPPMSMREIVDKGFEKGALDKLIEIVEKPVRRFRLFIPTAPQVFDIFRSEVMTREEVEGLFVVDVDTFGELEPAMRVAPNVTVMDVLKVQRYFNFISCIYQRRLEGIEDEKERTYFAFTSPILVIKHDQLLGQFLLIFGEEVQARAAIDLISIDYGAAHFDLQYTPLIDLGTYYVIAPHVLAASNLVRNVTVAKRLRDFAIGPKDRMVSALLGAFEAAGFKVRSDVKFSVKGKKGDLDMVAWRDGVLFIMECKNAYHPCSPHEMRNSYGHINKGREQLDVRRQLYNDSRNQAALFVKLGWDVQPTTHVHTGIIIANRVFHGARFNGHPVRQAKELMNVLLAGTIADEGDGLRFWEGETFTAQDLITYLEGDSIVTKQLAAMEPYPNEIDLGGRKLVFNTHALNVQTLNDTMLASYGGSAT